MKKMLTIVLALMAFVATASKAADNQIKNRDPDAYVSNFETAHSELRDIQEAERNYVLGQLQANPKLYCRIKGLVSDLAITSDYCWITEDNMKFELYEFPGGNKIKNEINPRNPALSTCQVELGTSRATVFANWLVENGILPNRVQVWNDESVSIRKGGNYPNQAVGIWFDEFPCPNGECTPCPEDETPIIIQGNTASAPPTPEPPVEEKFQCVGWGLIGGGGGGILGFFAADQFKSTAQAGDAKAEASFSPWLGAAIGAAGGAVLDCTGQYIVWRINHPKDKTAKTGK